MPSDAGTFVHCVLCRARVDHGEERAHRGEVVDEFAKPCRVVTELAATREALKCTPITCATMAALRATLDLPATAEHETAVEMVRSLRSVVAAASAVVFSSSGATRDWPIGGSDEEMEALESLKQALRGQPTKFDTSPTLRSVANGDAGDYSSYCDGCDEERDESHAWAECMARLRAERTRFHDAAFERHEALQEVASILHMGPTTEKAIVELVGAVAEALSVTRRAVAVLRPTIEEELRRGYVLTDEAGAGVAWRRRWNHMLGAVETVEKAVSYTVFGPRRHGIYIASKVKHGPHWVALRDSGVPIVSSWIDDGIVTDKAELWARVEREALSAAACIVYVEADEVQKGSLVEMGMALASGAPVFWVGPELLSATRHPGVRVVATVEEAVRLALAVEAK